MISNRVSIARIRYEFEEDMSDGLKNFDMPTHCEVPVDDIRDRVFESIDDALIYASRKLGYEIRPCHWASITRGWIYGKNNEWEWETDLNVNNRFQKVTEDEVKLWSDGKCTLYHMTICVSLDIKDKTELGKVNR